MPGARLKEKEKQKIGSSPMHIKMNDVFFLFLSCPSLASFFRWKHLTTGAGGQSARSIRSK